MGNPKEHLMIDFFGRKARAEITTLNARIDSLNRDLIYADDRIRELADIIRENDQLIWNMAQRTSWAEQRPFFNDLQVGMERRKSDESSRIGEILRHELLEVYRK
jgi:hypothetical protein